jgi:hypothetical protein
MLAAHQTQRRSVHRRRCIVTRRSYRILRGDVHWSGAAGCRSSRGAFFGKDAACGALRVKLDQAMGPRRADFLQLAIGSIRPQVRHLELDRSNPPNAMDAARQLLTEHAIRQKFGRFHIITRSNRTGIDLAAGIATMLLGLGQAGL